MTTIKTLFMAIVLSAVGYGAYVVLTGPSDSHPPAEATVWGVAPSVEMPSASSAPAAAPVAPKVLAASTPATPETSSHDAQGSTTNWPTVPTGPATPTTSAAPGAATASASPIGNDLGTSISSTTDPFATAGGSNNATTSSTAPGAPTVLATSTAAAATPATAGEPTMPATPPASPLGDAYASTATATSSTTTAASATDAHTEFAVAWATSQQQLQAGKLDEVLLELSKWVTDSRLSAGDRDRLLNLLDQLAGTVIYSRQHLIAPAYVVQPGDTLEKIATTYEVPTQLLMNINGLADPNALRPGDTLKVVHGPFDVLVDLQRHELTLFLHHMYAGRFPVYLGQDQQINDGEFQVLSKVAKPTYQAPTGQVIGPDDPSNPLGVQMLDLGQKLSIHGSATTVNGTIDTRGSIRLSATDINDVFNIVSVGSHVIIWK